VYRYAKDASNQSHRTKAIPVMTELARVAGFNAFVRRAARRPLCDFTKICLKATHSIRGTGRLVESKPPAAVAVVGGGRGRGVVGGGRGRGGGGGGRGRGGGGGRGRGGGGGGRGTRIDRRVTPGLPAGAAAAQAAVEMGVTPDDVALFVDEDDDDATLSVAPGGGGGGGGGVWGKPMVAGSIAAVLKEHQWDGVRFLWRHAVEGFESQEKVKLRLRREKEKEAEAEERAAREAEAAALSPSQGSARGAARRKSTKRHHDHDRDDQEGLPGCILAHSMGMGKTLQTVCFLHTLSTRQPRLGVGGSGGGGGGSDEHHTRAVLVVPANVVSSWNAEFSKWLPRVGADTSATPTPVGLTLDCVYVLGLSDEPTNREGSRDASRTAKVEAWRASLHGVLVITFDLFATYVDPPLAGARSKGRPTTASVAAATAAAATAAAAVAATAAGASAAVTYDADMTDAPAAEAAEAAAASAAAAAACGKLLIEGAAIVVVDEAHEIRNVKSKRARAFQRIATTRRIALTGYPLQNNIYEYFSMIDFVAPGILGDEKTFTKRFGKAITVGLKPEATSSEKNAMKKKLSALNDIVVGFMRPELTPQVETTAVDLLVCYRPNACFSPTSPTCCAASRVRRGGEY
jgi:hypothetical protein